MGGLASNGFVLLKHVLVVSHFLLQEGRGLVEFVGVVPDMGFKFRAADAQFFLGPPGLGDLLLKLFVFFPELSALGGLVLEGYVDLAEFFAALCELGFEIVSGGLELFLGVSGFVELAAEILVFRLGVFTFGGLVLELFVSVAEFFAALCELRFEVLSGGLEFFLGAFCFVEVVTELFVFGLGVFAFGGLVLELFVSVAEFFAALCELGFEVVSGGLELFLGVSGFVELVAELFIFCECPVPFSGLLLQLFVGLSEFLYVL